MSKPSPVASLAPAYFDLTGRSALVTGAAGGIGAGAFVFRPSDAASNITGQLLPVDGGMVM
jgi:NAD(P)-dependent dehydrogenase (short-subunit alcohol dehydrogenase family)